MELRYRMAVVTGAGGGLGREVAVALGRRGMAVLVADRDRAGAQQTVDLVRACRVVAWACQVDLTDACEVDLLAGRARDLGGADVLVNVVAGCAPGLAGAFVADLSHRRDPTAPAAVVHVVRRSVDLARLMTSIDHLAATPVRMLAVVRGSDGPTPPIPRSDVCTAVIDLLDHGSPGQVVELEDAAPRDPRNGPRPRAT